MYKSSTQSVIGWICRCRIADMELQFVLNLYVIFLTVQRAHASNIEECLRLSWFAIASKGRKYLRINLIKELKDLYVHWKLQSIVKKTKDDTKKGKIVYIHWLEDLILFKQPYHLKQPTNSMQSLPLSQKYSNTFMLLQLMVNSCQWNVFSNNVYSIYITFLKRNYFSSSLLISPFL